VFYIPVSDILHASTSCFSLVFVTFVCANQKKNTDKRSSSFMASLMM